MANAMQVEVYGLETQEQCDKIIALLDNMGFEIKLAAPIEKEHPAGMVQTHITSMDDLPEGACLEVIERALSEVCPCKIEFGRYEEVRTGESWV